MPAAGGSTEAKPDWHAFKPDDLRKESDDAFLRVLEVKDGLRKRLFRP